MKNDILTYKKINFNNKSLSYRIFSKHQGSSITLSISLLDYKNFIKGQEQEFFQILEKELHIKIGPKTHFQIIKEKNLREILLFIKILNK